MQLQRTPFAQSVLPSVFPLAMGRWELWELIRHLFPENARAVQTDAGSIAISWPLDDDPHATQPAAAPIVIRASDEIFEMLEMALPAERRELEHFCVESVRQQLPGYDPYAAFPQVRLITIGS